MLERSILANRLRDLMEERSVTQKELAALLGISPGTLCRYISETQVPHLEVLCRLHELCGEPVESILGVSCETEPCTFQTLRAVIRRNRKNLTRYQRSCLIALLSLDSPGAETVS